MERLINILMDINPDIDYKVEKNLVDSGLFDSVEIIMIVTELEDNFHINIEPEDIIAENFNSMEDIWRLVCKYGDVEL